ncbi:MAG: hypothetical protein KAJ93_00495 [Methanosarcinales archaeon]|nr:hypothetical protein [Methanosarcinales archaeon]
MEIRSKELELMYRSIEEAEENISVVKDIIEQNQQLEDDMEDKIETGSVCDMCSKGTIALMTAMVGDAELDNEPYKEGVKEGANQSIQLEDYISLSIHACDYCGYVYSVDVE